MRVRRALIHDHHKRIATDVMEKKIKEIIDLYEAIVEDPEKEDRLSAYHCIYCHYVTNKNSHPHGVTTRQCGLCEVDLLSPTSNIDSLCTECAISSDMCAKCGGNVQR